MEIFKIKDIVSGFFQLVLEVLSQYILNIVDNNPRISEIPSEKSFEVRPYDKSSAFMAALILSLFEANSVTKF